VTEARAALDRLLRLGERAWSRGDEPASVSLPMTPAKCPEYCALRSLDDFEAFEAGIALAVQHGAITTESERYGAREGRLKVIRLRDLVRLGEHLDCEPLPLRHARAEAALADWRGRFPVIEDVLASWKQGKSVRGHDASDVDALADAAKAIDALLRDDAQDRLLRRESWRLFNDSKRLESLIPWLDVLLTGETGPSGLEQEQILATIGLRRQPQPLLIAGEGTACVGGMRLPLCRPYLGLPVEALERLDTTAAHLLTIENLTSFHDAARCRTDGRVLLLYTAGMPSPAWRRMFTRLLAGLPADVELHHWGDIDEGGFRIAATLAGVATGCGRTLRPWRMSPDDIPPALRNTPPSPVALRRMQDWARRASWPEIAEALARSPVRIEQEALDPILPGHAT
jgi:hypothetical protein